MSADPWAQLPSSQALLAPLADPCCDDVELFEYEVTCQFTVHPDHSVRCDDPAPFMVEGYCELCSHIYRKALCSAHAPLYFVHAARNRTFCPCRPHLPPHRLINVQMVAL